jgi:putative transposase
MSSTGNPYDNATCESFLKTLKREEIHAVSYHNFEELHGRIEEFIKQYYNRYRLHSALKYRSPEGFEDAVRARPQSAPAAILNFFA